jgi:hypothetical protein
MTEFRGMRVTAGISVDLFLYKVLGTVIPSSRENLCHPNTRVRHMGYGFLTWGPERTPRTGKGDGYDLMTRFILVVESGFP